MSVTVTSGPIGELHDQVGAWVQQHYGSRAVAGPPVPLDGHSGLTFLVSVSLSSGELVDEVVLRLPPAGVKPSRNTDVLRQVSLLRLLSGTDVPVASVLDPGTDTTWFGRPFLVVRRMPGATRSIDGDSTQAPRADHVREAMSALGLIHRVALVEELSNWDRVQSYPEELASWDRALERMPNPDWRAACARLRDCLSEALPQQPVCGLVHGDFQFSNILFEGTRITAVLDWEVASLGPQMLDLGWFLTINDQDSWAHQVATDQIPEAEQIVQWYEEATHRAVDPAELSVARALAAYRFAVIAGLNLALHRSGRRVDPHWERIAPSIPTLVETGMRTLGC